jgi:hypothetical protein
MTSAALSLKLIIQGIPEIHAIRGQILKKEQHVAVVLPILLPANPLTIKDVADVADFPDLHINLARFLLSEFASFEWFVVSPVSHDLSVFVLFLSRHSLGGGGCALCGKMISQFTRFSDFLILTS